MKNLLTKLRKTYFIICLDIIFSNKIVFFNYIFYQLKYEEGNGYYLGKRIWVWLLISPFRLCFEILAALLLTIYSVFFGLKGYTCFYIVTEKKKLKFVQKMKYTLQLKK